MDSTLPCKTCNGRGPVPRWIADERGDMIPVPFDPCLGCGLDWPVELSSPSYLLSHGLQRPSKAVAAVSYATLATTPDILAVVAVMA